MGATTARRARGQITPASTSRPHGAPRFGSSGPADPLVAQHPRLQSDELSDNRAVPGGRSWTCTDVEAALISKFAQIAALTTYARNEQVRGLIPRGGSQVRPRPLRWDLTDLGRSRRVACASAGVGPPRSAKTRIRLPASAWRAPRVPLLTATSGQQRSLLSSVSEYPQVTFSWSEP